MLKDFKITIDVYQKNDLQKFECFINNNSNNDRIIFNPNLGGELTHKQ